VSAVAVYEGTVRHRRMEPVLREFAVRIFLAYLDVDALPGSLDPFPGWSGRRWAAVQFRRRDFFDGGDRPLGPAVRDLVEQRLGRRPSGRVCLLAQLRTFGWLFNPLAVYYCWDAEDDKLDAVVLEVTNTPWGERHWYVFDGQATVPQTTAKAMHVSPFLPMDADYQVSWTTPGDDLHVEIRVGHGETVMFAAGLALRRSVLDRQRAATVLVRYPLAPMRVSVAIYRKALALFLRRVPLYPHPPRTAQGAGS
jgi:uncharacterized protein